MRYYFILCTDKARFVHFFRTFYLGTWDKVCTFAPQFQKMLLVSSSIKRFYYNFIPYEIKNRSTC